MNEGNEKHFYAARNRDETVVMSSRSGGVFTALSDYIISSGGIVYGCVLQNCDVVHSRATSLNERNYMRNSKYAQSNLLGILGALKDDVNNGELVLFTGTPCQCAAVRKLVEGFNTQNLYIVDLVCQGVASPMVWGDYVNYAEEKLHGQITTCTFRDKSLGWKSHEECFQSGNKIFRSGIYRDLISQKFILRPSCFECPYKNLNRVGDITLGDLWGVEEVANEFNDNRGVSLIIVNNSRGGVFFQKSCLELQYKEIDISYCKQRSLHRQLDQIEGRNKFWQDYNQKKFSYIVKKYTTENSIKALKRKIKRGLKMT